MLELMPSAGNEEERDALQCYQQRTKLEKKLLVASIFVGAILIGFIVDFCLTTNEDVFVCKNRECIIAASEIIKQVDREIEPCDNFFKFACGKLKERLHHKNVPEDMLFQKIQRQMQHVLEEPIHEDDHQAIKDEKMLHQACVNEQRNGVSLEIVKSLMNDLNGWPVLMGTAWNEEYFHWPETLIKLKGMGLKHHILFGTYLTEERNTTSKTIQIKYVETFDPRENSMYMYKHFLKRSAMVYGASETEASEEVEAVFQFIGRLHQITRVGHNSSEIVTLPLSEFQGRYPQINWVTYFESILSPKNITMEDQVSVPYPDYMDRLLELIHTSKRAIANYILWKAMGEIMRLTSPTFVDMINQIACVKGYAPYDETAECRIAMYEIFSPRPMHVNYAQKYFTDTMRKGIKKIFGYVFIEFKNMLKQSSWLDENSYRNVSKWLDDLKLIIGTPEDEMVKAFGKYKPLANIHQPFLKIYLEARKKRRLERNDDRIDTSMLPLVHNGHIIYIRSEHVIMIPTGFLQGMYYNPMWPMYLNFGGIGKAIAIALNYDLTYTAYMKVRQNSSELWATLLHTGFKNLTGCLQALKPSDDPSQLYSEYTQRSRIGEITGITLAYKAYKKWLKDDQENSLIGLDYTPGQLFWIWTYSQSCYDITYETPRNWYAENEVVRQNVHFATDFNCALNSEMNPERKCNIF
ncbi:neprilysin-2-like isoform X2 [Photinus pyralis]|uniref:neprilysin-2-like isoform X2 n=1 Tax=Photinus pyralis TaxID=7054 RepID=UPI0012675EAC|nr:neprilysin-2-like isoform X2 [Photinus pyralis]